MIALQRMRMACDSTYLVDHKTRNHNKPQELLALLEDVLAEDEGVKVVVFSQWLRMQELVAEALEEGPWGFVRFHGGVPTRKRRTLVRQFQTEPETRLFLSTDAGGTGLNLQAGSIVVNLDLPWNPAVLEQRIGRVHRLGQHRPVRVVNFVSEGTIEHGMISVLRFKRELFEGVLDGGPDTVDLGGTRLSRFMESVEAVTEAVPDTAREGEAAEPVEGPTEEAPAGEPAVVGDGAGLGQLLVTGARLLEQLGRAMADTGAMAASDGGSESGDGALAGLGTERDPESGRTYLKVPLPEGEVLEELARAAQPLLELLARRS